MPARGSAAGGGVILVSRFAAIAALNYGLLLALAWLLPPAEFGKVSVIQAVLLLAAMALNSGFPWTVTWMVADRERLGAAKVDRVVRTAMVGNLAFSVVLALGLLGLLAAGVHLLPAASGLLIAAAALAFPLFAFNAVGRGMLHGLVRLGGLGLVQTGEVVIKCLVCLALVVGFGLGAEAVALGFLAGAAGAAMLAVYLLRDRLPHHPGWESLATYRATWPLFLGTAGFALLATIDVLGLQTLGRGAGVTSVTLAVYQVAVVLARAPYFVGDALVDAVFPYVVRRHDDPGRSHAWFQAALRWIVLGVLPLQLVLIISPQPLLALFFPASYGQAVPLVRLIALGGVGMLLTGAFGKALQALRRRAQVAGRVLVALAVESVALVALVPRLGATGAALSFALGAWTGALTLVGAYYRYQWGRGRVPLPRPATLLGYGFAVAPLLPLGLLAARGSLLLGLAWLLIGAGAYVGLLCLHRLLTPADIVRVGGLVGGLLPSAGTGLPAPPDATRRERVLGWLAERPLAVAATLALASFLVVAANLTGSPDTLYDEVVYTRAAQTVASQGRLTWQSDPVFVHPPVYFLVQGSWLWLTGRAGAPLFDAVHATRLLTALLTAVNVGLVALLAQWLAQTARPWRRLALGVAAGLLMAFDPVILRYGRLALIEPLALACSLVVLLAAWRLRGRPAGLWITVVGGLSGLALLVKEITVFVLVVPAVFAALQRHRELVRRAVAALAVAAAAWLIFPAWAAALGLSGRFGEVKLRTLARLLGTLQITGWNRPTVSFLAALQVSAPQYLASYLLLGAGVGAMVWLWLRRNSEAGDYLLALLASTYAFGAYMVTRGTLNEQFFVYLLPGAIVATVLAADAALVSALARIAPGGRPRRLLLAAAPAVVVAVALAAGGANWAQRYRPGLDNGIERVTAYVNRNLAPCTVLNASGDVEKYRYSLNGRTVTNFASGPGALSRGVHWFFLNPKDVFARYGHMNQDLATWIRGSGRQVASFPSDSHWTAELWYVAASPYDPAADSQPVKGGVFSAGSECGGYPILDTRRGLFFREYQALGGKQVAGRALSAAWARDGRRWQALDGAVLATVPRRDGRPPAVRAAPLVAELARDEPGSFAAANLPPPTHGPAPRAGSPMVRTDLRDPGIARFYLRVDPGQAGERNWRAARERFGDPLGPPRRMADGMLRQPFQRVILERPEDRMAGVRLAPVGRVAADAGLVPAAARAPAPAPNLDDPPPPARPSQLRPFLELLGLVALVWAVAVVLARRGRARRRVVLPTRLVMADASDHDPGGAR